MFYNVTILDDLTKERFGYSFLEANSHSWVACKCNNCNKILYREKRNANSKHQCSVVTGNKKRCFRCCEWKDLSLFNKNPKLSGGVGKMCRECYNNHPATIKAEKNRRKHRKEAFLNDIDYFFRVRVYQIKNNSKRKNIPCNIDIDYLKNLWKIQNGNCYYTNLKMSAGEKNGFQNWLSPSIDRKTPDLGYVKGNIVWCVFAVNSFKQTLTEKEFEEKIKTIRWWTLK